MRPKLPAHLKLNVNKQALWKTRNGIEL